MARLDPTDLTPGWVLTIVLILLAPLCAGLWANSRALDFDGARAMGVDRAGELYIQVQNRLLHYDSQGRYKRTIDLADLGVKRFLGDLSFFPNNDLLLRRGDYQPGFLESISIFFRQSNNSASSSQGEQGLFRCNLQSSQCRRFSERDFNRGFASVIIDSEPDDSGSIGLGSVLISDASRHTIVSLDQQGRVSSEISSGLEFPNHWAVDDNEIRLIDTNNKRVRRYTVTNGKLLHSGPDWALSAQHEQGYSWPFDIEAVHGQWWLIVLDNAMNKGGIQLLDSNGGFLRTLSLPEDSTPAQLKLFNNQVLMTDIEGEGVSVFNTDGSAAGEFDDQHLQQMLALQAQKRADYRLSSSAAYALMVTMMLVLAGIYRKALTRESSKVTATAADCELDPADLPADTHWLRPASNSFDPLNIALYQRSGLGIVLLLLGGYSYYSFHYSDTGFLPGLASGSSFLLLLLATLLFLLLAVPELGRMQLGVAGNRIIIRDRKTNALVAGSGNDLIYDGRYLAIANQSVGLYQFRLQDQVINLYPILMEAQTLKQAGMRLYLRRNGDRRLRRQTALVVVFIAVFCLFELLVFLKMT